MQKSPATALQPDIIKCFRGMTAFTTLAKPPQVDIIILMALIAGTGQVQLAFDWLTMTGVTVEFFVRPIEFEIRLLVVVKPPDFP